jgi:hypothetical protein
MNYRDVEDVFIREIHVPLLDIEGDIRKWINKEKYEEIACLNFLDTRYPDEAANQKLLLLDYRDNYEGVSFKYILAMWILAFITNDDSHCSKGDLVHTIISKSDRVSTLLTFKNFIFRYLDIILNRLTWNFMQSPNIPENDLKKQFDELVNCVYTKENIEIYGKAIVDKFIKFIGKEGIEEKNLLNEFILPSTFRHFFQKFGFLLDVIKLRENFYDLFSKKKISINKL